MREPEQLTRALADEAATRAFGTALARALTTVGPAGFLLTLQGDLGAGKTTLARALLAALGVAGPVRSPTYTLLESYPVAGRLVHHLDWYRLASADDLEGLGFRDLCTAGHWLLVEWPERIPEVAARADLAIALNYDSAARRLRAEARTEAARRVLAALSEDGA